ncbi:MAG: AMP-binding protein, partial [Bacteroidota bacterium]
IIEGDDGLEVEMIYCSDLFTEETMTRLGQHFQQLLQEIIAKPQANISELNLMTLAEQKALLAALNEEASELPINETMVQRFEQQVERLPLATALTYEDTTMTFLELHEKSNQLANHLLANGLESGDLVALCMHRSFEQVIALLGILKAGAAYLPLDPASPKALLNQYLTSAAPKWIISDTALEDYWTESAVPQLLLDSQWEEVANASEARPEREISPNALMSIHFELDENARAKGVRYRHAQLSNLLLWAQQNMTLQTTQEAVLYQHTLCSDAAPWELFWPLLNGLTTVIAPSAVEQDLTMLRKLIQEASISTLYLAPARMEALLKVAKLRECKSIKRILCSGEHLQSKQVRRFKRKLKRATLYACYSPSELATNSICWTVSKDKSTKVLMGQPIANTKWYVLNAAGQATAIGEQGELFLTGKSIAEGHQLDNQLLPLDLKVFEGAGTLDEALFRTGTLVRRLADGSVEYLGRTDRQMSHDGQRITVGAIEVILNQSTMVEDSFVMFDKDEKGQIQLVAYLVPNDTFTEAQLLDELRTQLPSRMIPQSFVSLTQIPKRANGSVDLHSLFEQSEAANENAQFIAPRNQVEEDLAEVWKSLLGVEKVSVEDNFFELGGDSIITIQMVSRAKRAGYDLKPRNLFDHQTVAELAQFIQTNNIVEVITEEGFLTGGCDLLPIQQEFLEVEYDGMHHYNQSMLLQMEKNTNEEHLEQMVRAILAQHDALRFCYTKENGVWQQSYGDFVGRLDIVDLQTVRADQLKEAIEIVCEENQASLNLEKGELIRFVLMKTPEDTRFDRLFVVIHHLAVDGVSWRILLEDVQRAMEQLKTGAAIDLGPKASSYRQWVTALKQYAVSGKISSEHKYWKSITEQYQPLPVDRETIA